MPPAPRTSSVADEAPTGDGLTDYDRDHLVVYLRLLDAETARADWREVATRVLNIDPDVCLERARSAWESHLARARWMTTSGYAHLLRSPQRPR